MSTDRAIQPLVAQFVPLKIETEGEPWQKWSRKYPSAGQGIPIVYIIRADGEKMYGMSGALKGNDLPALLARQLQLAGEIPNEQQLDQLIETVEGVKKALADNDTGIAVKRLGGLRRLGIPGRLGSFAKPAVEVDQLYRQLTEDGKDALAKAQQKVADEKASFEGVLALLETERMYGTLPELRADVTKAVRDLEKDESLRDVLKQAQVFNQAKVFARSSRTRPRAISWLEAIISHFPDSQAARFARQELDRIDEMPDAPTTEVAETAAIADSRGGVATGRTQGADAGKKAAADLKMAKLFAKTRPEKAREYAKRIIEIAPDSNEAQEAQKLLAQLK